MVYLKLTKLNMISFAFSGAALCYLGSASAVVIMQKVNPTPALIEVVTQNTEPSLFSGVDTDNDGISNELDNCPTIENTGQWDKDKDGLGNECDDDIDGDGFSNNEEVIAGTKIWDAASQPVASSIDDSDGDGIDNEFDNCPAIKNSGQWDKDKDGLGNECDDDIDGDGYSNQTEVEQGSKPWDSSSKPSGVSIFDLDGDGVDNEFDNCPKIKNPGQWDKDQDNVGNECDDDIDGDGASNADELVANTKVWDENSFPDVNVDDVDNDGIKDEIDLCINANFEGPLDEYGCDIPDEALKLTPQNIYFIGNSYTFYGPVPELVGQLATYAGFSDVNIAYTAVGGATLEKHRRDDGTYDAVTRLKQGWDTVVLQEQSRRPTDSGNYQQFYQDGLWFYDYIQSIKASSQVVTYQTWARHPDNEVYDSVYQSPDDMQAQLTKHYSYLSNEYIPQNSDADNKSNITMAPVGQAWQAYFEQFGHQHSLHDPDQSHSNANGQYISALILYASIFNRGIADFPPLQGIDKTLAAELRDIARQLTQHYGSHAFTQVPEPMAKGVEFKVDFGELSHSDWNSITRSDNQTYTIQPSLIDSAAPIHMTLWGFEGANSGGDLGAAEMDITDEVSQDSLWFGSFDTHQDALNKQARVVLRGLPRGEYRLELFASRSRAEGRQGLYTINELEQTLDASFNANEKLSFDVQANRFGEITLSLEVAKDSISRFVYLNYLTLTKL